MRRYLFLAPAAALLALAAPAQQPAVRPEPPDAVIGLDEARRLGAELQRLLEDGAEDLKGDDARALSERVGEASAALERLRQTLQKAPTRPQIERDRDILKAALDRLATVTDRLGPGHPVLRRDAERVQRASLALSAVLTRSDAPAPPAERLVLDLAVDVAAAAEQLRPALRAAAADEALRRDLDARLDRVTREAGELRKAARDDLGREALRRCFDSLDRAWLALGELAVARGLPSLLPPPARAGLGRVEDDLALLSSSLRQPRAARPLFEATQRQAREGLDRWQGRWRLVSEEVGGKTTGRALVMTVRGDLATVTLEGVPVRVATLRLDPARRPPVVEMTSVEGETTTRAAGIYDLVGDRLRCCMAAPGMPAPTRFETAPGSGYQLTVWRRE
jgi:uncharacterized protein (TIGR03067 family)